MYKRKKIFKKEEKLHMASEVSCFKYFLRIRGMSKLSIAGSLLAKGRYPLIASRACDIRDLGQTVEETENNICMLRYYSTNS